MYYICNIFIYIYIINTIIICYLLLSVVGTKTLANPGLALSLACFDLKTARNVHQQDRSDMQSIHECHSQASDGKVQQGVHSQVMPRPKDHVCTIPSKAEAGPMDFRCSLHFSSHLKQSFSVPSRHGLTGVNLVIREALGSQPTKCRQQATIGRIPACPAVTNSNLIHVMMQKNHPSI